MNVFLWILQGLLALIFLATGTLKIVRSKEQLAAWMGWVENTPQSVVRLIGIMEILGAVGLILPSITGILPWLSPLAATGLAMTMVGATLTHYQRHEMSKIGLTILLLFLSLFVVVGRFWIMPL